jgi:alkylation response protein AidB-like acyl-CoA dehydrogenase
VTPISVTSCPVNAILMAYGNAAQKKQWLTPLAQGHMLGAFCQTEPHVGSDASSLHTTAVKVGDEYLINGVKQFITSGKNGHVAIVIAVTDKGADKKGMSAFLEPLNTPGFGVARLADKLGQHSSDTAQINFDDCRVPVENLIGAEGEGYKIALAEQVCSAALQTLGGYGYVSDFPVERIYRDVRLCQIYEGTSDVQKILIQRALA